MRQVADILRGRTAAVILGVVGVLTGLAVIPLAPGDINGDAAAFVRWVAIVITVTSGQRLIYLGLLDRDLKFSEGHKAGFRLGRQTSRPVVVPLIRAERPAVPVDDRPAAKI